MYYIKSTVLLIALYLSLHLNCSAQKKLIFYKKKQDSIELTIFVKKVYKWHNEQITIEKGFDPKKRQATDTMYSGIDMEAVNFMINKLRNSGFFDEHFLANYRNIALHMDKELKTGAAKWREGALPPFNHDADPWCNCPDAPGNYWQKIKIDQLETNRDEVNFQWTWVTIFIIK